MQRHRSPQPKILVAMIIAVSISIDTSAQWLNYPTSGIPRLANGRPDLSAPVPRAADGKPDMSGVWVYECRFRGPGCTDDTRHYFNLAAGLKSSDVPSMTPWAAVVSAQRKSRDHVDDPFGYCLPPGVPRINFSDGLKILRTPTVTALLYETSSGMMFRQVFTDGRPLPEVTEPTWLGYSIGRWDGDVFVVETAGFRDGGWLDAEEGRPHSDALRVTERFRRIDVGHMELLITINDPKAFLKPWETRAGLNLLPDTELLEAFCDTQSKIMEHWRITPAPPELPSQPVSRP